MKEAVVTIRKKYSDKFEGQSKGSTVWFNIDHEFLRKIYLHLNQTPIKKIMKRILMVKKWNPIKQFFVPFEKEYTKKKCNQCTKLDYSIRSNSTRSNSGGQTSN